MSNLELLEAHRRTCRECRKGFCTPATVLELMAEADKAEAK